MARYTEAVCRLCRRENQKLFLKGDRCYSAKCPVTKRATVPGQHAKSRRKTRNTVFSFVKSRRPEEPTAFWRSSSTATMRKLRT